MLVLQSKRKRIEDTTKMYSKLRNSFDFLISLLSDKSMWQVLDMFFTSKSKIGFSFKAVSYTHLTLPTTSRV